MAKRPAAQPPKSLGHRPASKAAVPHHLVESKRAAAAAPQAKFAAKVKAGADDEWAEF